MFTGPPGTGKTTVARIIGRLYGTLGVVTKGHLVEATRADLVAAYVGQTALKVTEVVNRAVGGVLFIDEAYALSTGDMEDYGGEAVATLVKLMEDHRDNLAVIVAGYRDEIWDFIHTNPGLRSRFTRYIDFPDFTADEMTRIFGIMAAAAKVQVGDDVTARVRQVLTRELEIKDFGNARFVRTLFERAYANMADRVTADDKIDPGELALMIVADLPGADVPPGGHSRQIGFRPIGQAGTRSTGQAGRSGRNRHPRWPRVRGAAACVGPQWLRSAHLVRRPDGGRDARPRRPSIAMDGRHRQSAHGNSGDRGARRHVHPRQ